MRVTILGAGKVGTAVARTALRAGHTVRIAGSGEISAIDLLVRVVAPGAIADTTAHALEDAEVVVLSIPVIKYRSLNPELLAGHVVIDAMNYWPDTDGHDPDFVDSDLSSSEVVAGHLDRSRVVKTLNHIGYHELETDGSPETAHARRGLAVVSDDMGAAEAVADFVSSLGYDPVIGSRLELGKALEPGAPIFGSWMTAEEVAKAMDAYAAASLTSHGRLTHYRLTLSK